MLTFNQPDDTLAGRIAQGYGGLFYGVYPAIVTDIEDPDGQGRIRIRLPWSLDPDGQVYEAWARIATLMAGDNRGTWFIPEVNDEVLVSFGAGDPRHPFVVGMLWNGQDSPPESSSADNNIKSIHSRNGVVITFDDSNGSETLTLETPAGQTVKLIDGQNSIELQDSSGNSIKMNSGGVTIDAAAQMKISCSMMEISAGMLTVNAGMSKFSGVVQSDTVITNSTVSATYTPGAGNIW